MSSQRMSAIERLRLLPETFSLSTFCRLTSLQEEVARVYLHRWKATELIEPAGERVGFYFNRLRVQEVTSEHRVEALLYEYPLAVLSGKSVLHALGWTTQIPHDISVTVLTRQSQCGIHGFEIQRRSKAWFKDVYALSEEFGWPTEIYGLKALHPAVALADMYSVEDGWHPDYDDLDIPDAARRQLSRAFAVLGVPPPDNLVSDLELPRLDLRKKRHRKLTG